MQTINRHLLYILPKQPLIDWINRLDPESPLTLEECTGHDNAEVYLIPEFDNEEMAMEWMRSDWLFWFDLLLNNWWTDEDDFPQDRSFAMLKEYFDITYQSMIFDMVESPIIKEEHYELEEYDDDDENQ